MISAPYFLACKFAAFDNRGNGDYLMSHDIEDIVAVLDGRPGVVEKVKQTSGELQHHLIDRFQALLANYNFMDALPGHLPPDTASQERVPIVIDRMKAIAELGF